MTAGLLPASAVMKCVALPAKVRGEDAAVVRAMAVDCVARHAAGVDCVARLAAGADCAVRRAAAASGCVMPAAADPHPFSSSFCASSSS